MSGEAVCTFERVVGLHCGVRSPTSRLVHCCVPADNFLFLSLAAIPVQSMEKTDFSADVATPSGPQYGPTGYGEYLTPYNTTVFYHDRNMFETAVAMLCGGQAMPLVAAPDYNA